MIKVLLIPLCLLLTCASSAYASGDTMSADLDKDHIPDTLIYDRAEAQIICKLSSQQFRSIKSKTIEYAEETGSGIELQAPDKLVFYNNWMRANYHCLFRYEPSAKKIRLIGMSREEFGNAANDGSGYSSVNLLTGAYLGNWNYYDNELEQLIAMPVIKTQMIFKPVYLEAFSDRVPDEYSSRCANLYGAAKARLMKRKRSR